MKQLILPQTLKSFFLLLFASVLSFGLWAQEESQSGGGGGATTTTTTTTKKTSISINSNDGANDWYTSPWVWVVGAAVFILLLVALLSNRGRDSVRTDRIVTKTVEKDRSSDI